MYYNYQHYRSPYTAYGLQGDEYGWGSLLPVAGALYADGDYISLPGGTYELDSGGVVTPGNTAVAFTGAETAAQMAALLLAAFQAGEPSLTIWWDDEAGLIRFRVNEPGVNYPIGVNPEWPVESEYAGITGGELGAGQPARFGPVRAMVIGSGDGRQVG